MTRTTTTKLVATALAVASLGLATTAQADDGQGLVGENDVQVQKNVPTPGNPAPGIEDQAKDNGAKVAAQEQPEEVDYNSPEYFKSKEAKDRYERYCNMKDAEPSHSDKKFCEDYRRVHGTGSSSSTGNHGKWDPYCNPNIRNIRFDPYCGDRDKYCKTPEGMRDHRCRWIPKPHPNPHPYPHPKKPVYEKTSPVYYKKAEEPSYKKTLPFTGLEIWQVGLIGIVLVGGGIGARRLLVS